MNNKKTKDNVRVVEMEYQRRCCEVTRLDKIRWEKIRKRMKVTSNIKYFKEKSLMWYGHVIRIIASRQIGIVTDETRWVEEVGDDQKIMAK